MLQFLRFESLPTIATRSKMKFSITNWFANKNKATANTTPQPIQLNADWVFSQVRECAADSNHRGVYKDINAVNKLKNRLQEGVQEANIALDHTTLRELLDLTQKMADYASSLSGYPIRGLRYQLRESVFLGLSPSQEKMSSNILIINNDINFPGRRCLIKKMCLKALESAGNELIEKSLPENINIGYAVSNLRHICQIAKLDETLTDSMYEQARIILEKFNDNHLLRLLDYSHNNNKSAAMLIVDILSAHKAAGRNAHKVHPASTLMKEICGVACHPNTDFNIVQLSSEIHLQSIPNCANFVCSIVLESIQKDKLKELALWIAGSPVPCFEGLMEHLEEYTLSNDSENLTLPKQSKWFDQETAKRNLEIQMEWVEMKYLIKYVSDQGKVIKKSQHKEIFQIMSSSGYGDYLKANKNSIIDLLAVTHSDLNSAITSEFLNEYLTENY